LLGPPQKHFADSVDFFPMAVFKWTTNLNRARAEWFPMLRHHYLRQFPQFTPYPFLDSLRLRLGRYELFGT